MARSGLVHRTGRIFLVRAGVPSGGDGSEAYPFATPSAAYAAIPAGAYGGLTWNIRVDAPLLGFIENLNLTRTDLADLGILFEATRGLGGVNMPFSLVGNVTCDLDHINSLAFHNFPIQGDIQLNGSSATPAGNLSISADYSNRFRTLDGDITGAPKLTVIDATNATPIEVQTSAAHGYVNGDRVWIRGVLGNTAANGAAWTITVTAGDKFTLTGSVGNGAYTSGGKCVNLTYPRAAQVYQYEYNNVQNGGHILLPYTAMGGTGGLIQGPANAPDIEIAGSVDYLGFRDSLFNGAKFLFGFPGSSQPESLDTRFLGCRFYAGCAIDAVSGTPGGVGFDSASWRSFCSAGGTFTSRVHPFIVGGFDAGRMAGATLTDAALTLSVDGVGASGGFTGGGNYYELPASTLTAARSYTIDPHNGDTNTGLQQTIRIRILGPQSYNLTLMPSGATVVAGASGYVDLTTDQSGTQYVSGSDIELRTPGNIVLKDLAIVQLVDAAWFQANPTITMDDGGAAHTGIVRFDAGTYARFVLAGGTVGTGVTVQRIWSGVRQTIIAKRSGADADLALAAGSGYANIHPQQTIYCSPGVSHIEIKVSGQGRNTINANVARYKVLVDGTTVEAQFLPLTANVVNFCVLDLTMHVVVAAGSHTVDVQVAPDPLNGTGDFKIAPSDAASADFMQITEYGT